MEEQSILRIILGEFHDKLKSLKDLVQREAKFPNAPNKIKVAVGMRRTGKTYFIYESILKLLEEGVPLSRILFINFEDDRLLPLDQKKLALLVEAFYTLYPENHDLKCYLFLDEIQNVEDWPIVIRRFHDSKNVELFLTGSSAKLLSKEISTSLRGRSLSTEIWPYSFNEFMKANNYDIDRNLFDKKTQDLLTKIFLLYLSKGGFPEVTHYEEDVRKRTLQDYVDVVIFKDIIERHKIKNASMIKYMILSMIHNISSPFTVNKFYNDLKSQGYSIGKDTLYEYADHVEDAYLAFSLPLNDRSIRKVQTNPKKIYSIDPGLVRATTLDYESNLGRLFENVVYLDLRRQGCAIDYYLTSDRYEIDFIVQTPKGKNKFFQVVWDTKDKHTLNREHRALEAGKNELKIEGDMVTLESYLREGIRIDE